MSGLTIKIPALSLMGIYGGVNMSLAGTLSGTLGTPFGAVSFLRVRPSKLNFIPTI
jgi:hypothetical protein